MNDVDHHIERQYFCCSENKLINPIDATKERQERQRR